MQSPFSKYKKNPEFTKKIRPFLHDPEINIPSNTVSLCFLLPGILYRGYYLRFLKG
jgi:hypothetical protein